MINGIKYPSVLGNCREMTVCYNQIETKIGTYVKFYNQNLTESSFSLDYVSKFGAFPIIQFIFG